MTEFDVNHYLTLDLAAREAYLDECFGDDADAKAKAYAEAKMVADTVTAGDE